MEITIHQVNNKAQFEILDNELLLFVASERFDTKNPGVIEYDTGVFLTIPDGIKGISTPSDYVFNETTLLLQPTLIKSGSSIKVKAKSVSSPGRKAKPGDQLIKVSFMTGALIDFKVDTSGKKTGTVGT